MSALRTIGKLWILIGALCLTVAPFPVNATDNAKTRELKAKIEKIRDKLRATEGERKRIESDLEETDKLTSIKTHKINKLKKEIRDKQRHLATLRDEKSQFEQQSNLTEAAIKRELRYAYFMMKQHPVKLILNQDNPSAMGRNLTYYQYFNQARTSVLTRLSARLEKAHQLELALTSETSSLEEAVRELGQETILLKQNHQNQTQIIRNIQLAMRDQQQALAKYRADESRLSQLTEAINEISRNADSASSGIAFADQKGKLNLPVNGSVSQTFGSWRSLGQVQWKGWLIETPAGTDVRAIWPGQVVFSDWLRGYGYLVILDHGAGYMTLYAHNQSLLKTTGDAVAMNETIASAGNSGGQSESSLYFEIRKDGKAVDPANWMLVKRH